MVELFLSGDEHDALRELCRMHNVSDYELVKGLLKAEAEKQGIDLELLSAVAGRTKPEPKGVAKKKKPKPSRPQVAKPRLTEREQALLNVGNYLMERAARQGKG